MAEQDMQDKQDKQEKQEYCLRIKDLHTSFYTDRGVVHAVRGVTFDILKGEMLGVVGESGSGKSVTAFSALNQLKRPGKVDSGQVLYKGTDLLSLNDRQMRQIRGSKLSMIFQEPLTALNPAFTIGWQIKESYKIHGIKNKNEIREKTVELLNKVKLPDPERRIHEYSYQFSGGMRQRALIAIAIACNPELVFADEPTTALDVTVQAEILELLQSLQESMGMSVVLISHNLNLVGERCKRMIVLYGGKIVEAAPSEEIFRRPIHPYTTGLLKSLPSLNNIGGKLSAIPGEVPNMMKEIAGCSFAPRCAQAKKICAEEEPRLKEGAPGHLCACHLMDSRE